MINLLRELSHEILHRLGATGTFVEVDAGFLSRDQVEQRFEHASPTLTFARCASAIAYEQRLPNEQWALPVG